MSELPVARHYHCLPDGRRMHYLACGLPGNPAVLLLHPSPMSANFMRPVMTALCDRAHVIAPDTPGYGWSDPLADESSGLAPFVAALADLVHGLKMKPIVYGSSTGAQLAIELAKAHPGSLAGLLLDNAAHFEDVEREYILSRYFPDRTPVSDGSHLAAHWLGVRNLYSFFPWFDESPKARLKGSVAPLEVIQAQLLDQLRAGTNYSRAYRAAFENERVENILPIVRPVRIIRWQGSLLWPWMQSFDRVAWPEHIQLLECGPGIEERMQTILSAFDDLAPLAASYEPQQSDFATSLKATGAAWSVPDEKQALHWRGHVKEKSFLLIHDLGASSRCFAPLLEIDLPVLAVDLPGHGGSGCEPGIESAAERISADLEALGVNELHILGVGLGAAIGTALSKRMAIGKLLAVDVGKPAELPALQPGWGGGHLQELWYALKDRCLHDPWNQRVAQNRLEDIPLPSPGQLHSELLDMLTSAPVLELWHRELEAFDWSRVGQESRLAHWRRRPPASGTLKMPQEIHLWAEYLSEDRP